MSQQSSTVGPDGQIGQIRQLRGGQGQADLGRSNEIDFYNTRFYKVDGVIWRQRGRGIVVGSNTHLRHTN